MSILFRTARYPLVTPCAVSGRAPTEELPLAAQSVTKGKRWYLPGALGVSAVRLLYDANSLIAPAIAADGGGST
jgi:hypothetical protein